ncbi:MAG: hypothetical protein HY064_04030 [Bacteroidetes bacterium]|nr:hypothetical protein [Bacteroidota bacterium]
MAKYFRIFLFFFLFPFELLHAQDLKNGVPFKMSVRGTATVPHGLANKAYRRSFTGIYDVTVNFSYAVFHGFQIGIQYETNLWKTADNKIPGINTYAQSHHGGIRVGYDRVVGDNSVWYVGLTMMEGQVHYYGLSILATPDPAILKTKYIYKIIAAETGVYFYTEGSFAIGIQAAVDLTDYHFDPYRLYLNEHKAYIASDLNGNLNYLNVGFMAVYSFRKEKAKT